MKILKRSLKIIKNLCDHNNLYYKYLNQLLHDIYIIFCKINKNFKKQLNENILFYSKHCLRNSTPTDFSNLIYKLYRFQFTNIYIYIMTCLYLDKINHFIQINKFNFQTIFSVLLQLSDKYYNDFYYSNSMTLYLLNIDNLKVFKKLEIEVLKLLNYNMYFNLNEFCYYEQYFIIIMNLQYKIK